MRGNWFGVGVNLLYIDFLKIEGNILFLYFFLYLVYGWVGFIVIRWDFKYFNFFVLRCGDFFYG